MSWEELQYNNRRKQYGLYKADHLLYTGSLYDCWYYMLQRFPDETVEQLNQHRVRIEGL